MSHVSGLMPAHQFLPRQRRQGALDEALAAVERALEAAKALKTPEVRERAVKDVDRTRRFILDLLKNKGKR